MSSLRLPNGLCASNGFVSAFLALRTASIGFLAATLFAGTAFGSHQRAQAIISASTTTKYAILSRSFACCSLQPVLRHVQRDAFLQLFLAHFWDDVAHAAVDHGVPRPGHARNLLFLREFKQLVLENIIGSLELIHRNRRLPAATGRVANQSKLNSSVL